LRTIQKKLHSPRGEWIVVCLLSVLFLLCFYHKTVLSGFDLIPGDNGDSRFNMLIAEHWIDYLRGNLKFHEVRMFYPADYSFGFSDLALLIAVFELPFRMCGFDVFRSYQI